MITRITSIDVLRGFALLGMLLMNIMGYAMNDFAYSNPMVAGGGGINRIIHGINHIIADQKMMGLFSLLFGASVILYTDAKRRNGERVFLRYLSRNVWLFLFGLAHLIFLWRGDILQAYAIASLIIYLPRKLPAWFLLPLGLSVFLLSAALEMNAQSKIATLDEKSRATLVAKWEPTDDILKEDAAYYRGDYWLQVRDRYAGFVGLDNTPEEEKTAGDELWEEVIINDYSFRAVGMMLVGMALFKMGWLSAEKSQQFYKQLAMICLGIGYPLALVGLLLNYANGWAWETTMIGGRVINNFATPFVVIGYVGLVMAWCQSNFAKQLQARLSAVGRTALTCYISHSIICTLIFYGYGLGLYGSVNRVGQLLIVFAIWALQLAVAPLWLKQFRYGPLEWLWRSLTTFKLQSFMKRL